MLVTVSTANWDELKNHLIREFDQHLTRQDVYAELIARRMRRDETVRQYIIAMQGLANHSDVSEAELVQFTLDGLDDLGPSAVILYNATTIQELKDSLARYERRRVCITASRPIVTHRSSSVATALPKSQAIPLAAPNAGPSTLMPPIINRSPRDPNRCANCRMMGHQEATCHKPRRPAGSCFYCWEMGHLFRDCPKKRQTVAAVAAPGLEENTSAISDETLVNELAALQMVSFSFDINATGTHIHSRIFALFDTGSPVSFIRRSFVPVELQMEPLNLTQYRGLGNTKISSYGNRKCHIRF